MLNDKDHAASIQHGLRSGKGKVCYLLFPCVWKKFTRWRHQLDVRQLKRVVEFVRMRQWGRSLISTIDLLWHWPTPRNSTVVLTASCRAMWIDSFVGRIVWNLLPASAFHCESVRGFNLFLDNYEYLYSPAHADNNKWNKAAQQP